MCPPHVMVLEHPTQQGTRAVCKFCGLVKVYHPELDSGQANWKEKRATSRFSLENPNDYYKMVATEIRDILRMNMVYE